MKNWRDDKINYIEHFYGGAYRQFKEEGVHDDRMLYVNTYEMIIRALKSLRKNPDIFVKVAMNHHLDENLHMMQAIGKHFGADGYIFRTER